MFYIEGTIINVSIKPAGTTREGKKYDSSLLTQVQHASVDQDGVVHHEIIDLQSKNLSRFEKLNSFKDRLCFIPCSFRTWQGRVYYDLLEADPRPVALKPAAAA